MGVIKILIVQLPCFYFSACFGVCFRDSDFGKLFFEHLKWNGVLRKPRNIYGGKIKLRRLFVYLYRPKKIVVFNSPWRGLRQDQVAGRIRAGRVANADGVSLPLQFLIKTPEL